MVFYLWDKFERMRKLRNEELDRLSIEEFKASAKMPLTVVLDNVRSLNNIGSIFRTCDGFRVQKLVLCGISTPPPHRDIYKTALGAENSVAWEYFGNTPDAIESLKKEGYNIASVEQAENSIPLDKYMPPEDKLLALVFGHEIKGVSQSVVNMSDSCIEIPQYGSKHSFNISVSVGIVLWDISLKIGIPDCL
jgi:tRNA G18 (ribose-2'-O)-methylase SpoU